MYKTNSEKELPTINIFSHFYLPHVGGIEQYTFKIATLLKDKGFTVNIITSNFDRAPFKSNEQGITIYRLKSLLILKKRFPIPLSIREIKRVKQECFPSNTHSVTILNSKLFLTSLLGLRLSIKRSNKIVLIEHGSATPSLNGNLTDKITIIVEKFLASFYRNPKVNAFGVSKAASKWLSTFGIKSHGELYNGVLLRDSHSKKIKKKNIVLFVGRLIPEKGIDTLIEAFIQFKKESKKNYSLVVIGDNKNYHNDLGARNTNIIFTGALSNHEVLKFMRKAKIFINPSSYPEGLSTTILEAAANECFVITTGTGGNVELINQDNSYLLDNAKLEAVLKSLKHIDKLSSNDIDKCTRNLKERIMKEFNIENTVAKLIQFIH